MKKFQYKHKRFLIQAKRPTEKKWTEWTRVDDFEEAVKHSKRAEELGYCARIIDKEADNNCNDCARIEECEKATHVENYRIKGCMDFKKKVCTDCRHFVGCECFSGMTCSAYEGKKK